MATEKRLIDASKFEKLVHNHRATYLFKDDVLAAIAVQPTVDAVEVVHGHWIDRPSMKGQVYCSECATIEKSTDSNYKSKHCPGCSARMDGGADHGL